MLNKIRSSVAELYSLRAWFIIDMVFSAPTFFTIWPWEDSGYGGQHDGQILIVTALVSLVIIWLAFVRAKTPGQRTFIWVWLVAVLVELVAGFAVFFS